MLGKPSSKEGARFLLISGSSQVRMMLEQLASWVHPASYKLDILIKSIPCAKIPPQLRMLKSSCSTDKQFIRRCKSYCSHADVLGEGHCDAGSGYSSFSMKSI